MQRQLYDQISQIPQIEEGQYLKYFEEQFEKHWNEKETGNKYKR